MPSPLPVDRVEYHRRRWIARGVTSVALVLTGLRVRRLWLSFVTDDANVRLVGGWLFFLAGLEVIALGMVTVWAWRRSYAARAVVLPVDASAAVAAGVPELDGMPEVRHVGLSGTVEPPRRW